jgi:2-polyprenyl-6-methoxyphenol hydroxylase-like FAD-dependent oxidoreductase
VDQARAAAGLQLPPEFDDQHLERVGQAVVAFVPDGLVDAGPRQYLPGMPEEVDQQGLLILSGSDGPVETISLARGGPSCERCGADGAWAATAEMPEANPLSRDVHTDVCIVGAGIAGLAIAGALAARGREVVVLEERPEVTGGPGGISLWPNAMAALARLGLEAEVRRTAREITGATIRDPTGRVLHGVADSRTRAALGGLPLVASRQSLVDVLVAKVPAGSVRTGIAVVGFDHTATGVRVKLADGTAFEASALIGADGYRSRVAEALHSAPLRERYAGYPAWRGVAPIGGLEPMEIWGRGQIFGVAPLDEESTFWFAARREAPGGTAGLNHLCRVFHGWTEPIATLLAATPPEAVSRVDVCDRAQPRHWCQGRVLVVGDAAHPMRPHLGQGGCQALLDAATLVALLDRHDLATAFAAIEATRRRPVTRVVRASRSAGSVLGPRLASRLVAQVPDAVALRLLQKVAGAPAGAVSADADET